MPVGLRQEVRVLCALQNFAKHKNAKQPAQIPGLMLERTVHKSHRTRYVAVKNVCAGASMLLARLFSCPAGLMLPTLPPPLLPPAHACLLPPRVSGTP